MMGVSVEARTLARWERWEKMEGEVGAIQGVMAEESFYRSKQKEG